jgi:hypothetical protein
MSYDQKKGRSQIENLIPDHKSFESRGQMRSDWSVLYTIGKIFSRAIRYQPCNLKKILFEKYMNIQSFGITKVPILGLPFRSPEEGLGFRVHHGEAQSLL